VHRAIERRLVALGRFLEPADFPNELERGVVQLLVARAMIVMSKPFDIPAHRSISSSGDYR
jgi:hypothetical protein